MLLPVAPGGSTDMRFELERVNGQWRIASAPAGIILDRATFTAIWSAHQIYFIGPTGVLIPETRWFQSRAALSTEIVNALLEGPGERVAGVVHSGFPPGTELVTGAVTVVDGVARIELSQEVLEAGEQAAKEMFRQLHQSMRTVTGVNGFEVVVDGVEVREPDAGETQPSVPPAEPSNPAVMIGDQFGTVVAGEFVATERLGDAIVSLGPDAVVLSPDESAAAVRNGEGISRVDDEVTRLVDQRGGLLVPSFDPMGYIWTLPAGGGELRVTGGVDETYTIEAPWLRELTPAAISVSPDGARLAVLVPAEGNRSVVYTAGIVREANGAPVRTTATVDAQLWASGNPIDIDWVDTLRFATLTESGNTSKVTVGGPGLFAAEQGSVAGGDQIASGGSRTQLRVLSGDGDLYMSQGSGWQRLIGDVEVLAKRG